MTALSPLTSQAQPPAAPGTRPLSDAAAFSATQNAAKKLDDPEAAAALYSQFLREHPKLSPFLTERSYSAAALLRAKKGDVAGALSLLDEGAGRIGGTLGAEMRLLGTRASVLVGANRAGEAEAALEPKRQQLLRSYPSDLASPTAKLAPTLADVTDLLVVHLNALEAQKKWSEMAEAALEVLWRVPSLLKDSSVGSTPAPESNGKGKNKGKTGGKPGLGAPFYDRLILALQKAKRPEEALGWAKVRFELCAFEKGSIDRAVASLRTVWIGNGELGKAGQFNTFLREGGATNPLQAIARPTLETREVEAYLVALVPAASSAEVLAGGPDAKDGATGRQFGGQWGRQMQRVSLLLLLQKHREAAQVAQGILQAGPKASVGPEEIARVLKARDGSLESGNRFFEFLKTGEGDNPLQGLLAP